MKKNWIPAIDIVFQEECPGPGFVAVEDIIEQRFEGMDKKVQMFSTLTYERLENIKKAAVEG